MESVATNWNLFKYLLIHPKNLTLIQNELPATIDLTIPTYSETGVGTVASGGTNFDQNETTTYSNPGGDKGHNNMQPWYGLAFVKKQY